MTSRVPIWIFLILFFSNLALAASSTPATPKPNYDGPFGFCSDDFAFNPLDNFCPRVEGITLKRCCKPIVKQFTCYYYTHLDSRTIGCGETVACVNDAPVVQTVKVPPIFVQNSCCLACPPLAGYPNRYPHQYTTCGSIVDPGCPPPGSGGPTGGPSSGGPPSGGPPSGGPSGDPGGAPGGSSGGDSGAPGPSD